MSPTSSTNHGVRGAEFLITLLPALSSWRSRPLPAAHMLAGAEIKCRLQNVEHSGNPRDVTGCMLPSFNGDSIISEALIYFPPSRPCQSLGLYFRNTQIDILKPQQKSRVMFIGK